MLAFTAAQTFPRAQPNQKTRNGSVDLLRFVGAIGIIQFHCAAPGGWIGLAALPMFVMLLVYFGAAKPIEQQAKRLLLPWLVWSAIYGALKLTQSIVSGTSLSGEFAPWMVLTGTALHLWFLPFSFLFLLICAAIPARAPLPLLSIVCVLLSVTALWIFNSAELPIPFAQWFSVIPAACAGLLMQRAATKTVAPMALACGGIAALYGGMEMMTPQLAISGLVVLIAMAIQLPQTKLVETLSGLSLGMYLVHPAVIALTLHAIPRDGSLLFPIVLIGSILIAAVLKRLVPEIV